MRRRAHNDEDGHSKGDRLICDTAALLKKNAEGGKLFRMGGDEFLVLLPDISQINLNFREKRIRQAAEEVNISLSIGTAWRDPVEDWDSFLREADQRMYLDKERRHQSRRQLAQQDQLSSFTQALREGEFTFFLQPVVEIRSGLIIGAEALARWKHGDTIIAARELIPKMEESGFITRFDLWLWEQVVAFQRRLMDDGLRPVPISFNISDRDFYEYDVVQHLLDLIKKYRVPKHLIHGEVREISYRQDAAVRLCADQMRQANLSLTLDDFGNDRDSIVSLPHLECHAIKISLQNIPPEKLTQKLELLESAANISHRHSIILIPSGVETKELITELTKRNCSYAQGDVWYRAMDPEKFKAILQEGTQISYEPLSTRIFHVGLLDIRNIIDEQLLTNEQLNRFLGPMAVYEVCPERISLLQINQPCCDLTGIDIRQNMQERDLLHYVQVQRLEDVIAFFDWADQHPRDGVSNVIFFLRPDGVRLQLFCRTYPLVQNGNHRYYLCMLHRCVPRDVTSHPLPEHEE